MMRPGGRLSLGGTRASFGASHKPVALASWPADRRQDRMRAKQSRRASTDSLFRN